MNESRAAIRYAKATLELAVEKKAADKVEIDMQNVASTINSSNDLQQMLSSPVVNGETKKKALKEVFKGANEITFGLLDTLTANKRIGLLLEVAKKYIDQFEKMKGEAIAYVTTAVPLNDAMEQKVLAQVKQLTTNKVTLQNKVDQSIVGGFILRIGDLQYDASVSNKLNTLKREFTRSL